MATKVATQEAVKTKGRSVSHEAVVRAELIKAKDANENSYMELASLLHEAHTKKYYGEWGHDSFEDYCDNELEFSYRKAKYLVEIWDKVTDLKLDLKQVTPLGWTKLKELVIIMNSKNAAKWLDKATKMSTRELTAAVKAVRQKEGDPGVRASKTTLSLTMSEAEAQVILDGIETAKGLLETDNVVLALEMICQEWLEYKGAVPEARSLDSQVDYLEKAYGVSIEVKTKKKKKIEEVEEEVKTKTKKPSPSKSAAKDDDDDLLLEGDTTAKRSARKAGKSTDQDVDAFLGLSPVRGHVEGWKC